MNHSALSPIPIIQAPIASAASASLCATVSNSGALGGVSLTWRNPDQASELLAEVQSKTSEPFYANFVLHFDPLSLAAAISAGLKIVTFSWGDPTLHIDQCRKSGLQIGIQVTSRLSARAMLQLNPDFLIVQGVEAGGHVQAHQPLSTSLFEVLEVSGETPVYAAGGLANGSDLASVMLAGAHGGVFGTRFLASIESEAHPKYKERITEASAKDTVLTNCFNIGWEGAPHRVLINSTFQKWEASGCPKSGFKPGEGDILGSTQSGEPLFRYEDAMPRHDMKGDWEPMCLYAGTSTERIHKVVPASQIVESIWRNASKILSQEVNEN